MASETVISGETKRGEGHRTYLLSIDDSYVAIDKNSFPLRQSCVFASLYKCDCLSLY